MSTSTGPGRPDAAMWNASAITRGMSLPSRTRKLCLVIGMVMPEMSASWKASVPISAAAHLSGDRHHRDRVHLRVGQRRHQVGGTGTRRRHAHADPAGGVRVAAGGVPGALLVADQHVAQLLRVEKRVVDRQHGAAGDAEDDVDVELLQRPDDRLRAGELLRCNPFRLDRSRSSMRLSRQATRHLPRSAMSPTAPVVAWWVRSRCPLICLCRRLLWSQIGAGARKNPRQRKLLYEGCASMLVAMPGRGLARHQRATQLLRAIPGSA